MTFLHVAALFQIVDGIQVTAALSLFLWLSVLLLGRLLPAFEGSTSFF